MGDFGEDVHDRAVEAGQGAVVALVVDVAVAGAPRVGPVEAVHYVAGDAPAVGDGLRPFPGVIFALVGISVRIRGFIWCWKPCLPIRRDYTALVGRLR